MLAGDVRADDLARLFLYARDRCDGREAVREIGDFVAHHAERTKGITTREVRDWYRITSFLIPRFDQHAQPIYGDRLPSDFPDFLKATFRRVEAAFLRKNAQLRRADAHQMLSSLLSKFVTNADGTVAISNEHTKGERTLMEALCQVLVVRPAFDDARLFSDFAATLKSHALLKKEELCDFAGLRPAIALFAVAVMHNCTIQLGDGKVSRLHASLGGDHIAVCAPVPVSLPHRGREQVYVSSAIFGTKLNPLDYCKFDLLRSDTVDCDLELATPQVLLSPLV